MKLVFFGEDSFSLIVLDSLVKAGHSVLGVFCPVYKNNIHARLEGYCISNHIEFERIANFNNPLFINKIKALELDLIVVCHFQKIIKKELNLIN